MTQTKTSADRGSTPLESTTFAGVTQLVEYLVANQIVVGSSPITRSFLLGGKNEKIFKQQMVHVFLCVPKFLFRSTVTCRWQLADVYSM